MAVKKPAKKSKLKKTSLKHTKSLSVHGKFSAA